MDDYEGFFDKNSYGDGSVFGFSDGKGCENGYGYGYGDGYGFGAGYGYGDVFGFGNGNGSGFGWDSILIFKVGDVLNG